MKTTQPTGTHYTYCAPRRKADYSIRGVGPWRQPKPATPTWTGKALTEVLKKMGGDPNEAKLRIQGKVIQGGGLLM
jgi:hypothetical protein